MKKVFLLSLLIVFLLAVSGMSHAATNAQKQLAIDNGLAWLASTQQANGSWSYPYGGTDGATGAALLAFVEQKYKPGGWKVDYTSTVMKAANYLFSTVGTYNLSAGAWFGPCSKDGSNIGYGWGINTGEETYNTGLVVSGLARMTAGIVSPSTVITAPGALNGLTYAQVLQRSVDQFAWGQNGGTGNWYDGGWRYTPRQASADNSTTQWPVIGSLFAESAGATSWAQTRSELKKWIAYIQNPNGGSGYDNPWSYVNESKTGGLLAEMYWAGGYAGSEAMEKALDFLNNNWQNGPSGTWYGNFGHPYAMWSIYKGLELTIGLNDPSHKINNLLDPTQANWWEDYCEWLVNHQNPDGSWSGYGYWYGPLATAWNINILNGTRVAPPVPIPGSLLLLGSGLGGLAVLRRRSRK